MIRISLKDLIQEKMKLFTFIEYISLDCIIALYFSDNAIGINAFMHSH